MKRTITSWRTPKAHQPRFDQENPTYPATRFFDQLSFIGNPNVGCFLLETDGGLVLIDCMEPIEDHKQIILEGIADLGLDPNDLAAIVISHGHGDHYGCADWFREQYGCTVYMSKTDYEFAQHDTRNRSGVLKWEIFDFLEDKGCVQVGSQDIYSFSTPGHSPGCMSFVFKVTDEGREHWVAMWGGTGVPRTMPERIQYLESARYFEDVVREHDCDVEIISHAFVDMLCERLDIIRAITDGVPHPFIVGVDQVTASIRQFGQNCIDAIGREDHEEKR